MLSREIFFKSFPRGVRAYQQVFFALSAVLVPVFLSHAPPRIYDDDGIQGSNGGDAGPWHVNNWLRMLHLSQQRISRPIPNFSFTAVVSQHLIWSSGNRLQYLEGYSYSCCSGHKSEIGSE